MTSARVGPCRSELDVDPGSTTTRTTDQVAREQARTVSERADISTWGTASEVPLGAPSRTSSIELSGGFGHRIHASLPSPGCGGGRSRSDSQDPQRTRYRAAGPSTGQPRVQDPARILGTGQLHPARRPRLTVTIRSDVPHGPNRQ